MKRLKVDSPLFVKLSKNKYTWWQNIKKDKDLSIQIRKNNHIDVYYDGGAILRNLSLNKKGAFQGCIHNEYIPFKDSKYKNYRIGQSVEFDEPRIRMVDINNFSGKNLDLYKRQINKHFSKTSEKGIQFAFIKNDTYFIDAEIMDTYKGKDIRIDLVRMDVPSKKIVFFEVKTWGDSRLYSTQEGNIVDQLNMYKEYLSKNKKMLEEYYKKIYRIKYNLGILPNKLVAEEENIDEYTVEVKPMLLFGDGLQMWINANSEKLDKRIKNVALGCYYFGKPTYNCDLIPKTKKNRHIYG